MHIGELIEPGQDLIAPAIRLDHDDIGRRRGAVGLIGATMPPICTLDGPCPACDPRQPRWTAAAVSTVSQKACTDTRGAGAICSADGSAASGGIEELLMITDQPY